MFLLGLLYAGFVAVMFAAGASAVVMLVVVGGLLAAQYFLSDKIALHAMGAREVSPQEAVAEAEAQIKPIFDNWRARGLIGTGGT